MMEDHFNLPKEVLQASDCCLELRQELELLSRMPQARLLPGSVFDRAMRQGSVAQLRGIVVKLRCCKKSFDQKCNELCMPYACRCGTNAAA
ncbi:MAG: hypothetical protein SGPRY_009963 [Prymnesium sp.]